MDKLIFNFSDEVNPDFEKNCIRNILAKLTSVITKMDVVDLDDVEMIKRLSSTAIELTDEIRYLNGDFDHYEEYEETEEYEE
jgi:hypothetical protein